MPKTKMPVPILLVLTLGPALMIGSTLWLVNDLVPACSAIEKQRVTAPDGQFDLVTFKRVCGDSPANIQAALVPPGDEVTFDAASFVSVAADVDLAPGWDAADGHIEITLPTDATILRQDESVAGIGVTYR